MNVPNNLRLVSIHNVLTERERRSDPTLSRLHPNPQPADPGTTLLERQRERACLPNAILLDAILLDAIRL
jgi:hypothetical protein